MTAPQGWYQDPSGGRLRWWDGSRWTEFTTGGAAWTPPSPHPPVRPDGSPKGPPFLTSVAVLLVGLAVIVGSLLVVIPAFVDAVTGPRFAVPGSHSLRLEEGTWVLFERTWSSDGVSIVPEDVVVEGPAPVQTRSDSGGSTTETISSGSSTYTGAVRFDIETAGIYRIIVAAPRSSGGEVLVGRPVSDLFQLWPYLLATIAGGFMAVAGLVMWIVGAGNRRAARRVRSGH